MPVTSNSVRWMSSSVTGAPTVYANAGGMVGMLDAVLVNGFGSFALANIVVTGGVAVATITGGHTFAKWSTLRISGSADAGLNIDVKVVSVTGTTFTFDTTVANGTYAGGAAKYAPIGFEISYTGTNLRVYRPLSSNRNAVSLYVDDTNTVSGWNTGTNKAMAAVSIVTDVTSISTFTTLFQGWWHKGNAATTGTTPCPWSVFGDELGFIFRCTPGSNIWAVTLYSFLQFDSLVVGDQFGTIFECSGSPTNATNQFGGVSSQGGVMWGSTAGGSRVVARASSQIGVSVAANYAGYGVTVVHAQPILSGVVSGGYDNNQTITTTFSLNYPIAANSGFLVPGAIQVVTAGEVRGVLPGMFPVPHRTPLPDNTVIEGVGSGAYYFALVIAACADSAAISVNYGATGGYVIDLVGPWR